MMAQSHSIDCHTHTTCLSACSAIEPHRLCALALERGLSGVVLTEHQVRWEPGEFARLKEMHPGLSLYSGVEVSVAEGYDVVVIGPDTNAMFGYSIPFKWLLKELEPIRQDTFLFVAHPFRFNPSFPPELEDILDRVDGVEMNSVNILRGNALDDGVRFFPQSEDMYRRARERNGLVGLFNSDAHTELAVGAVANRIEVAELPQDEAGLARLLKNAAIEERQDRDLLRSVLGRDKKRGLFGW